MNLQKLVTSSANPDELSMTVRGILLGLVPVLMLIFNLDEATVNEIIDTIVQIVFLGTSLIASLQVAYGLVRKVYLGRWTALD